MNIPVGFCQCGCGGKTTTPKYDNPPRGHVAGVPVRFIAHHNAKQKDSPSWKGGKVKNNYGYVKVMVPDHPRADSSGYVLEHILVVEKRIGRFLVGSEEVHHENEIKFDNRDENLIFCTDRKYHNLLHMQRRALIACGHPSWRKCRFCKEYDDPKTMEQSKGQNQFHHAQCYSSYQKQYRGDHKEKANEYSRHYYQENKEK